MKRILLYTLLAVLATSCSDFLEEENLSNVTAESFYVTSDGYDALINANYSQLRSIYGGEAWLFAAGTDLYAEGRGRGSEPEGLSQYTSLNSSSGGVSHLYNTCYNAIQIANQALYYADLTSNSNAAQLAGEVKYMRANAYFLLVQTYGGVAIVTDYIQEPVLEFDRNSASEVYDLIVSDLEDALASVGDGAYTGRVNKRAVRHLLSKVHLTRGYESFAAGDDFSKAASYADAAIAGQGLDIPFEELWSPSNDGNAETIFSVQYDAASVSADPTRLGNRQAEYYGPYMGGTEVAGIAPRRNYTLIPTDFALELFDQDDERTYATFMWTIYDRYFDYYDVDDKSGLDVFHFYEPKWFTEEDQAAYKAEHPEAQYHDYGTHSAQVVSSDYQTIAVKKFDDPTAPFGTNSSTRDIVLARVAESYLIAAEAYLQSGSASTGLDRLNVVRARAGVAPATAAEFDIDYILDERARELFGEYHRWFDLKRTGKLVERASAHHYLIEESNFMGAGGNLKILRPIPQAALDLNQNRDFPQNPAYE